MKQPHADTPGSMKDFHERLFRQTLNIDQLLDYEDKPLRQIVSYWRRHKLVPFLRDAKLMHISYAELIWLRLLDMLREFGCSLADMQKVCDYFFKDAYYDDLPKKNLLRNKQLLLKKKLAGTLDENDNVLLNDVEESLQDEALMYALKHKLSYLTNLIDSSVCQNLEGGVYFFRDGSVAERIDDTPFSHRSEEVDLKKHHIYISLVPFLKGLVDPEELSKINVRRDVDKSEQKVLQHLRNKAISQVTIRLKEGKILDIDTMKSGMLTEMDSMKIKKILNLHNYETVTLYSRKETSLSFNRTKKNSKKITD